VVDDAGGDDIATTKVFTDVAPASDGNIHVDFTTPDAFVNAIEILQGTPHRMLPAGSSSDIFRTPILAAMFGCRTGTSSAAALVVSEVVYPRSPMVDFTNGIGLDTSIT
jgi:hypothetical protein